MFINPHVGRARRSKRLPLYKTTEGTSPVRGRGSLGDSTPDVWRRQEQEESSFVYAGHVVGTQTIKDSRTRMTVNVPPSGRALAPGISRISFRT